MARIATNYSAEPPLSPPEYSRERNQQLCRSSSRRVIISSSTPKQRKRWALRFRLILSPSPTRSSSDPDAGPLLAQSGHQLPPSRVEVPIGKMPCSSLRGRQ